MKISSILMLFIALTIMACNDRTLEQLNKANEEIAIIKKQRDSIMLHLDSTLIAIERNIGNEGTASNSDLRTRMKEDVAKLDDLMKQHDKKLKNVNSLYQRARKNNENLSNELTTSQEELTIRQNTVNNLNDQVTRLDRRVKTQDSVNSKLTNVNNTQSGQMNDLVRRLNTAYIITGKVKELRNKQLVEKEGGFLNLIGRVPILNPEYEKSMFATINVKKDTLIDLDMGLNDIKLITTHPEESYELINVSKDKSKLIIKNPEKFWEASRFLVIAKE